MPFDFDSVEPLVHRGLADYHVHCDYSFDAVGSIDEYCEAALRRGLVEICFTTHYDTNPAVPERHRIIRIDGKNVPLTPEHLEPYVEAVRRAHERYYPMGLSVKLGLEVGWWAGVVEEVVRLKERYPFEHVLCGIHEVDDLNICSPSFSGLFADYSQEKFIERYYRLTIEAVQSGLFDAVAHLGYYLRFGQAHFGEGLAQAHEAYLDELFAALKTTDTGLEINTSAIRHGFYEYYPMMGIVNAAKKEGVRVRFLGSDAHRPEQVGFDFDAAMALIPNIILSRDD